VDVRIVVATNRDMGKWRRKTVPRGLVLSNFAVQMTIPPLREGGSDVLLLARTLPEKFTGIESPRLELSEKRATAAALPPERET